MKIWLTVDQIGHHGAPISMMIIEVRGVNKMEEFAVMVNDENFIIADTFKENRDHSLELRGVEVINTSKIIRARIFKQRLPEGIEEVGGE
jgi:hypothetical protein